MDAPADERGEKETGQRMISGGDTGLGMDGAISFQRAIPHWSNHDVGVAAVERG